MAISSVNSGPPKSPACWPVTTATVRRSARRRAASRAPGGGPRPDRSEVHAKMSHLPSRSPPLNTEATGTAPPDAFGPFRVLHQIGAGTLGPVYRAYDAQRERLVAIKRFTLDLPPERVHQLVAA